VKNLLIELITVLYTAKNITEILPFEVMILKEDRFEDGWRRCVAVYEVGQFQVLPWQQPTY
jgi:hypothetical protein